MKKFLLLAAVLTLFTANVSAANKYINMTLTYDYQNHNYNAEEVFVAVDGVKLTNLTMPPIIFSGYTLVPAREVFEAMGAEVQWKSDTEQVYVSYNDNLVVIPIGSKTAYVNGVSKTMDIEAKIINNKTMIPLRFVSDALSFTTEWDNTTRTANIVTKSVENTETTTIAQAKQTEAATKAAVSQESSNVYFENNVLYIKNTANIQLSAVSQTDNYTQHQYIVEINGNLSSAISSTSLTPQSDYIASCNIDVNSSKTTVTFNENKIIAMNVYNDNGYLCLQCISPKEKYDKIVIIDPGHGGPMPGAMANDLIEKELTLKMALSVKEKLDADGSVKCYMTRLDDSDVDLEDRSAMANDIGGDMFISIHINSSESSEPHGTETYALYPNDLGNGLISYTVAEEMLNQLVSKLDTNNRGVKSNTYVVLKTNNIPATLLEIGFISNAEEAAMMNNSVDKVGQAVYDGIINLFEKYPSVR